MPKVEETKHLEEYIKQITKALFDEKVLYIDSKRSHKHPESSVKKYPDGYVWLPEKEEIWLVELETKSGSNFTSQRGIFRKSTIDESKLIDDFIKEMPYPEYFGMDNKTRELKARLSIQKYTHNEYLIPNIWVVLGHDDTSGFNKKDHNNLLLRNDYMALIKGVFEDNWIVTMVRMFTEQKIDEGKFILLDNYYPNDTHSGFLFHADPPGTKSIEIVNESTSRVEKLIDISKAEEVWTWFRQKYPDLKRDNLRLRLQPGFDKYDDFKIAWETESENYLYIEFDKKALLPGRVARLRFPEYSVPNNLAEKWGKYIDSSKDPPEFLENYSYVNQQIRESKKESASPYDPNPRTPRPCAEFFEDDTNDSHSRIKRMYNLWKAFWEKRILTINDLKMLSGITGQGRSASLDHILINFSVIEREGEEVRLKKEAIPYVKELLAKNQK